MVDGGCWGWERHRWEVCVVGQEVLMRVMGGRGFGGSAARWGSGGRASEVQVGRLDWEVKGSPPLTCTVPPRTAQRGRGGAGSAADMVGVRRVVDGSLPAVEALQRGGLHSGCGAQRASDMARPGGTGTQAVAFFVATAPPRALHDAIARSSIRCIVHTRGLCGRARPHCRVAVSAGVGPTAVGYGRLEWATVPTLAAGTAPELPAHPRTWCPWARALVPGAPCAWR